MSLQNKITASTNPYVFIVGTARSGTTLLRRMVNAHPDIAITRETHWITRFFKRRIGLTEDGLVRPDLLTALFEHKRFPHLKLKERKVAALVPEGKPVHFRDFVSGLFDLYGRQNGKPLVGDKTPPYVLHIELLQGLFPKARFIHQIRDGRDVCLSMLTWRYAHKAAGRRPSWEADPVSTSAIWWEWLIRTGREAGQRLPASRYMEISYQDLVATPEQQLRRACDFLDVAYSDEMLNYHRGKTVKDPKASANKSYLPPTQGLRNWREQMTEDQKLKFEAVAGELLDELELERACPDIPDAARAHAQAMRELFWS